MRTIRSNVSISVYVLYRLADMEVKSDNSNKTIYDYHTENVTNCSTTRDKRRANLHPRLFKYGFHHPFIELNTHWQNLHCRDFKYHKS